MEDASTGQQKKNVRCSAAYAVSMFIGKNLFYTITARNVNSYQYYMCVYISYGYDAQLYRGKPTHEHAED